MPGNTGSGTTDSNNCAIDTRRPTATVVVADDALGIGETSPVTITPFSEVVTGFTNADLTVANGTLSPVASSDGGTTWTATPPTADVTDPTNVITLANTGVTDAAGNSGAGTTTSNNFALDADRPTATVVVADGLTGETSLVTLVQRAVRSQQRRPGRRERHPDAGVHRERHHLDGDFTDHRDRRPPTIVLDDTGFVDLFGNPVRAPPRQQLRRRHHAPRRLHRADLPGVRARGSGQGLRHGRSRTTVSDDDSTSPRSTS